MPEQNEMSKQEKALETITKETQLSVMNWEKELEREAEISAGVVDSINVGKSFSLRNGILTYNGQEMPNNEIVAVILDSILENKFYEGGFKPDGGNVPVCFAFATDANTLAPHENSMKPQCEKCSVCPQNAWGSAERGRGKACRNTMRIAVMAAANFDTKVGSWAISEDPDFYLKSEVAFMSVSVTSVRGYAAYIKALTSVAKRPTWSVHTRISVHKHPKNQFEIKFDAVNKIASPELLTVIRDRVAEAKALITTPYQKIEALPNEAEKKNAKY